ncbi:hypothetical protein LCGC14_2078060 [marine sediment metagenome]|uniref:Uncharacterized protein n=1 Tax=marine sediment metagenome TaxID=412755 RepID=A0A0F9EG87_9ZZZZ
MAQHVCLNTYGKTAVLGITGKYNESICKREKEKENYYYFIGPPFFLFGVVILIIGLVVKKAKGKTNDGKTEVLWADRSTLNIMKTLFRIVKSEMSEVNQIMNLQERLASEQYLRVISNNFEGSGDNLHRRIVRRIKKLKEFHFRSGGLTVNFDEIIENLKVLRFNRIKFWENLLKDYVENEDFYLTKIE